jgi:hypothetical protein
LFNQDFKDMLFALSEAKADFLLVGAYAMAVHGHPRMDIRERREIWISGFGPILKMPQESFVLLPLSVRPWMINKRASGRPKDLANVVTLDPGNQLPDRF